MPKTAIKVKRKKPIPNRLQNDRLNCFVWYKYFKKIILKLQWLIPVVLVLNCVRLF